MNERAKFSFGFLETVLPVKFGKPFQWFVMPRECAALGNDKMLAVILQFVDGIINVGQSFVLAVFGET